MTTIKFIDDAQTEIQALESGLDTRAEIRTGVNDAVQIAKEMANEAHARVDATMRHTWPRQKRRAWRNDQLLNDYFGDKATVAQIRAVRRRLKRARRRLKRGLAGAMLATSLIMASTGGTGAPADARDLAPAETTLQAELRSAETTLQVESGASGDLQVRQPDGDSRPGTASDLARPGGTSEGKACYDPESGTVDPVDDDITECDLNEIAVDCEFVGPVLECDNSHGGSSFPD